MKSKRKLICAILVICMVATLAITLCACGEETTTGKTAQHKKAIIICTALISGGLYDITTGETVWDPISEDAYFQQVLAGGDMAGLVVSVLTDAGTYNLLDQILNYKEYNENLLWQISLDENGNSNNPNFRPANVYSTTSDGTFDMGSGEIDGYGAYTGTSKAQYGALAAYREQCLDLQQRYGKDWDVTVFNYDWRIDNRKNSELLEQFVNTNGWEQIVLTSHSMGGPVVAGYLARSEANRKKVLAYRAFSPATSGSVDAFYFVDDPVGACWDAVYGVTGETIGGLVGDIIDIDNALIDLAGPLAQNLTSAMQLLPSQQFLDSGYYGEGESCIYVDGEPVKDLYEFYISRPWAHTSDWVAGVDKNSDKLKPGMETLKQYWASFYVKVGDELVYAPELVNTTYCLGVGYNTKKSIHINSGNKDGGIVYYDSNNNVVSKKTALDANGNLKVDYTQDTIATNVVYYKNNKLCAAGTEGAVAVYSYDHSKLTYADGDGTMPTNACLGGQNFVLSSKLNEGKTTMTTNDLTSRQRPIKFYTADHGMVGCDWELLKYDFYDMVDAIDNKKLVD